jgi:acyl-CoA reductase-like NAD-dependent aldehyde dehydrogenase
VPADSVTAVEETFGPIAPVIRIRSLEDAIAQTNASEFGLMAAIFTRDVMAGLRYAESVRAGTVNINESSNYWESHLPFGGGGGSASGIGRVGGRYAMEALTDTQTVTLSG